MITLIKYLLSSEPLKMMWYSLVASLATDKYLIIFNDSLVSNYIMYLFKVVVVFSALLLSEILRKKMFNTVNTVRVLTIVWTQYPSFSNEPPRNLGRSYKYGRELSGSLHHSPLLTEWTVIEIQSRASPWNRWCVWQKIEREGKEL